jgi:hypothetical protein
MSAGGKSGVTRRWQGNDADPLPTRLACQRDRATLSPTGQVRSRSVRAESFQPHSVVSSSRVQSCMSIGALGPDLATHPRPPRSVTPPAALTRTLRHRPCWQRRALASPCSVGRYAAARWAGSSKLDDIRPEANQSSVPGHKLRCNAAFTRKQRRRAEWQCVVKLAPLTRRCIASFWRHRMISTAIHARPPFVAVGPGTGDTTAWTAKDDWPKGMAGPVAFA